MSKPYTCSIFRRPRARGPGRSANLSSSVTAISFKAESRTQAVQGEAGQGYGHGEPVGQRDRVAQVLLAQRLHVGEDALPEVAVRDGRGGVAVQDRARSTGDRVRVP